MVTSHQWCISIVFQVLRHQCHIDLWNSRSYYNKWYNKTAKTEKLWKIGWESWEWNIDREDGTKNSHHPPSFTISTTTPAALLAAVWPTIPWLTCLGSRLSSRPEQNIIRTRTGPRVTGVSTETTDVTVSSDPLYPGDLPHLGHLGDCCGCHGRWLLVSALLSLEIFLVIIATVMRTPVKHFGKNTWQHSHIEVHWLECCGVFAVKKNAFDHWNGYFP